MYRGGQAMSRGKYATLGRRARDLYAQGMTLEEISGQLAVSVTSLSNWKKKDAAKGADWDVRRSEHARKSPLALLQMMERKQEILIERMAEDDDPGIVDQASKLEKMIERRRREIGDYSTTLGVMEQFAAWCSEQLLEDGLHAVRAAVDNYLTDVKRGIA